LGRKKGNRFGKNSIPHLKFGKDVTKIMERQKDGHNEGIKLKNEEK
jgi:hypothetical protein